MRRNSTLPSIRQTIAVNNNLKSKQGMQSYRKIEDKIHSHDEQIVKNQKIISNLANEFRMLKEQLQFEQQYNEKYKNSMGKYEQQTSKHLKMIKDQKQQIVKLEHLLRQKQKILDASNKQRQVLRQKYDEISSLNEQISRDNKKKEALIKQQQTSIDKLKKQVKQRQQDIKQKQLQLKQAFSNDRQIRENKIKKLQKDIELSNMLLQNTKQVISSKDKQIQKLHAQIYQLQQKTMFADKTQIKVKNMIQQIKLFHRQNQDLKKKLKDSQEYVKNLEVMIKTQESKNNSNTNEKIKQLQIEKKQQNDKIEKLTKELEEAKKKIQIQKKQRQKGQKRQQQMKQKLGKLEIFHQKLAKGRIQIHQQLTKLKSNVLCDYCNKPMKNPVTNIPCGHSYCQDCKNGYLKQCKKCVGAKRQAVYRNQLLDEIIQASNLIERMVLLMSN